MSAVGVFIMFLDLGLAEKVLIRSGAWFRYGDIQLGQGREKTRLFLTENPEITQKLRAEVLAAGGHHDMLSGVESEPADSAAEEEDALSMA